MPPAAVNSSKNPDSVGRRWKLVRHLGSGRSNFAPGHHSFKWRYQPQPWFEAAVLDALPVHEVSGARIRPRAVWIRLLRSGSRQLGRRSPPCSPTPNLEDLMLCYSIAAGSWTSTRLASMADAPRAIGRRNHVERAVRSIRPQDPSSGWPASHPGVVARTRPRRSWGPNRSAQHGDGGAGSGGQKLRYRAYERRRYGGAGQIQPPKSCTAVGIGDRQSPNEETRRMASDNTDVRRSKFCGQPGTDQGEKCES